MTVKSLLSSGLRQCVHLLEAGQTGEVDMNVTGLSSAYAPSAARSQSTSAPTPQFAGHAHAPQTPTKGSGSNFGLITGLLTCCALVPFTLGVLVMGGIGIAARRTISQAKNFKLPGLPG